MENILILFDDCRSTILTSKHIILMKAIRRILVSTLILWAVVTCKSFAQGDCIIVSDMHFNPFFTNDGQHNIDTVLRNELAIAPVEQWDSILTAYNGAGSVSGITRGYDANYNLIKSAVNDMAKKHPHPDFIVITGDFIWHSYYKGGSQVPFSSEDQQHLLKTKTMSYLAGLIRSTYKGVPVIPALGNNDSDNDDYVFPSDNFLTAFAKDWNLNPAPGNKLKVDTSGFKLGGYYKARLGKQVFVVLNTTILSNNNPYNNNGVDSTMFAWLEKELSVTGQKVWIVSHIPPGNDMMANGYTAKLISIVKEHKDNVQLYLAAHTHFNDFRVIYDSLTNKAFAWVRMVSSVGPNHDNSPGYIYAEYDMSGHLKEQQHYLDLKDHTWKKNYCISTVGLPQINAAGILKFMQTIKDPFNSPGYLHFHSLDNKNDDTHLGQDFTPNLLDVDGAE